MTPFTQLLLAVSIPTLVSLVGIIFSRVDIKEVATELKNFRLEMTKDMGLINTRLTVIELRLSMVEAKLGITPPAKTEPTKEVAA